MSYFYRESPLLEEKLFLYFKGLADYNDKYFDGKLSVVLLGSFSRGEGTAIQENGKEILLSDIEFFTVYPDGVLPTKEYEEFIQSYAKEIFFENASSLFHVDNSNLSKSRMHKLEKKLLTYDAVHFGKCVVGENVMHLFPKIDYKNINFYDIRDILTHRVFSVLYYGLPLKAEKREAQYKYSLAKNSLDLMTVLLLEHGILESGFINRYKAVENLDIDDSIKKFFSYCLSLKLREPSKYDFSVEEMEHMFISLVKDLNKCFCFRLGNKLKNTRSILRRRIGILKRAFKHRHLPPSPKKHLNNILSTLEHGQKLTKKEERDNFILNGYPV